MIRFENIEKRYEDGCPIKNISGVIPEGKVTCFIGPSGCGKSTIARMINGFIKPTNGKIYYGDIVVNSPKTDLNKLRQDIGMVFQNYSLFNHLTILENLVIPQVDILKIPKAEAKSLAEDALRNMGLTTIAERMPSEVSGGQRQRAALIRAFLLNSKVIILDEPTSALDPISIDICIKTIQQMNDGTRTIIVISHDLNSVKQIADNVWFIDDGEVHETGTPDEIFNHPKRSRTKAFITNSAVFDLLITPQVYKYGKIKNKIENFCTTRQLEHVNYAHMLDTYNEFVVQVLIKNNPNICIKLSAYEDKDTKKMMYKIKYGGDKYNPFADSVLGKELKKHVTKVSYQYHQDSEYPNSIKFESIPSKKVKQIVKKTTKQH